LTTLLGGEFERRPPGDYLLLVERQRLEPLERNANLPGEGGIVLGAVVLHVVLRLRDHHAIDDDAGDAHPPRVERPGLGNALHLAQHHAARIPGREGQGQDLEPHGFLLRRHIAVWVGRGAADEGHVDGQCLEEKALLAAEGDQLDDVLLGPLIELAAFEAWVHEGPEAHLREGSGLARRDVAVEVGDDPLGQVIGRDLVLDGQLRDTRDEAVVPADDPLEQPFMP
jgi:hypothetical protein